MTQTSEQETNEAAIIPRLEMPTLGRETSRRARISQRLTRQLTLIGLIILVKSVIPDTFPNVSITRTLFEYHLNVFTAIGGLALLLSSILRLLRIIRRPEYIWRVSRIVAEQVKSLGWRYAVGGFPFGMSQRTPAEADGLFGEYLRRFADQLRMQGISLDVDKLTGEQDGITDSMRRVRQSPFDVRRRSYASMRIRDQQDYFKRRTHQYSSQAARSSFLLYGVELAGTALVALKALGIIENDLAITIFALAAAFSTWAQFTQFAPLSQEYGDMAFELDNYHWYCSRSDYE